MTDPMGRVFVSYRRKRIDETTALVVALRDRGIPVWRDVDRLQNEPTEDAIRKALEDPYTSGAVLWISPDVKESNIIKYVEVPLAVKRYRRGDGFWLVIALAGGTDYGDLADIFDGALGTEDLGSWNVTKVSNPKATAEDILKLARIALARRMDAVARSQGDLGPVRVTVDAKGTFTSHPSRCLAINWTPYFAGCCPRQEAWEAMKQAWIDVSRTLKTQLPTSRTIVLSGTPSLPAAVLMGAGFSTRDGRLATWLQRMPDGLTVEEWTHTAVNGSELAHDLGWTTSLQHRDANESALAVLINASDDTDQAVGRSRASLPGWRAVLSVNRPEGRNTRMLPLSAAEVASVVHMTIDALRIARRNVQPLSAMHFFIAGPAGLGVLLGTQLATLPPVTTYEFDTEEQKYVNAVRLIT